MAGFRVISQWGLVQMGEHFEWNHKYYPFPIHFQDSPSFGNWKWKLQNEKLISSSLLPHRKKINDWQCLWKASQPTQIQDNELSQALGNSLSPALSFSFSVNAGLAADNRRLNSSLWNWTTHHSHSKYKKKKIPSSFSCLLNAIA